MEYFFVCVYTKLEGIAKQDGTHWAAYRGVNENHFWVKNNMLFPCPDRAARKSHLGGAGLSFCKLGICPPSQPFA